MGWLLSILAWVVGKLFGKPPGPSQEAQEAASAAGATVTAKTDEKALSNVQKANEAAAVVDAAVAADPSSLRDPDPDSRD